MVVVVGGGDGVTNRPASPRLSFQPARTDISEKHQASSVQVSSTHKDSDYYQVYVLVQILLLGGGGVICVEQMFHCS